MSTATTGVPVSEEAPKRPRRIKRKTAAAKAAKVEPLVYRLEEAARALRVNKRTVERMVQRGEFPPPDVRMGRAIGWRVATVKEWLDRGAMALAPEGKKGGRA